MGSVAASVRVSRRATLTSVVGRLSALNGLVVLSGFVTGPLLARALGADGRGTLAAIVVPLGLAPMIASWGLGTFATREAARGRALAPLFGTLAALSAVLSAIVIVTAPAVAGLFAGGRDVVYTYILIGLLLIPVSLLANLLLDIAVGLEDWRTYTAVKIIAPLVSLVGTVALFLTGNLTVASGALVMIGSGCLVALPLIPVLRRCGRPRFERQLASKGLKFGFGAWIGGLGSVANVRLDQLLMIRMVDARELGLYVVAFTIATFLVTPVVGALSTSTLPRFATEGGELVARVLRSVILGVGAVSIAVAMVAPLLVHLLFGADFADAVPMAWVLLAANVPMAAIIVLSTALTAGGKPRYSAIAEVMTLAITVPGLLFALPMLGGLGAALVSVTAYSVSFTLLLLVSRKHLDLTLRELVIFRPSDFATLLNLAGSKIGRRTRTQP